MPCKKTCMFYKSITNQYDSFTSNLVKNISNSTSSSHHEIPKTKNNSYWWSSSICVDHRIGEREREREREREMVSYNILPVMAITLVF